MRLGTWYTYHASSEGEEVNVHSIFLLVVELILRVVGRSRVPRVIRVASLPGGAILPTEAF